jgi:aryl-alcohol dehydrogenase-like predicted oxidoreductase
MKLGIGTAQLGMNYGISNPFGKTSEPEAGRILSLAAESGVTFVDTARLYGDCEAIIGRNLPAKHEFNIVTKTPKLAARPLRSEHARALLTAFDTSCRLLRQERIYALLLHDVDDLLAKGGEELFGVMSHIKSVGGVEKIGASVYSASQIDELLARFSVDIIQVPVSIFDQRLVQSGHLSKLAQHGVEVHARSVFLQGLILLRPDQLDSHFDSVRGKLTELHAELRTVGITPQQAAFQFVNSLDDIDVVICGVNNASQLQELIETASTPCQSLRELDLTRFAIDNPAIVNPALWPPRAG